MEKDYEVSLEDHTTGTCCRSEYVIYVVIVRREDYKSVMAVT